MQTNNWASRETTIVRQYLGLIVILIPHGKNHTIYTGTTYFHHLQGRLTRVVTYFLSQNNCHNIYLLSERRSAFDLDMKGTEKVWLTGYPALNLGF